MPRSFSTDRLHLRPFEAADAPAIVPLLNDAEMCRGLAMVPYPYGISDAEWFIAKAADDAYAVCKADDRLIGAMGLGKQLGYWIGKPFWGQGYATEAAAVLLRDHFQRSDAPVSSGYAAWNTASRAVLRKLGFEVTGDKMQHIRSLGKEVPAKSVTLTRQAWKARA